MLAASGTVEARNHQNTMPTAQTTTEERIEWKFERFFNLYWKWSHPHGGEQPFHRKSTCLTQLTLGPNVVLIWSRSPRISEATKPSNSNEWYTGYLGLAIQGYLAHKKHSLRRSLQWPCAHGHRVILGGWVFPMSEVPLYPVAFWAELSMLPLHDRHHFAIVDSPDGSSDPHGGLRRMRFRE